ncbi:unannotated protein [freshwater metagenome]|uniref:Unannotated protein n=1 Tax=freshwater metagenome TaxID=449393 RepID=A0A6J7EYR9_9ZZZZ|nr:hypothetical protein [Actinomycetota bacterium]
MTNQTHAKRQPLLILGLLMALLPIFTFASISRSAAAGASDLAAAEPIDLLEGNLDIDFSMDRETKNIQNSSADKLFDGSTLDPYSEGSTGLTKYYPTDFGIDGIDIVFDFGIDTSRFAGVGATIRGVQLSTAADAPERDATSWTLEGSNDVANPKTWTLIYSKTGLTPPSDRDTDYEATMFPASDAFRFFRFKVTSTRGAFLNSQLSSLRFFGDPIVVSTQDELMAIGTDATTLGRDYVLGNDIVLDNLTPNSGYYIGDCCNITTFTGTFDGANHTISNLLGPLFQVVGDGETPTSITHLNLSTAEVGLPAYYSGILTEQLSELSLVNDVHVSGKLVQGEDCPVGGIAGRGKSNSSIDNSSADVTIELGATNDDAGGLIGSTSGNISNSFAKVIISGDAVGKIGGLLGTAEQGSTIINSASSGTIDGSGPNQGTYFGGLVGYSQGATITTTSSSVQINTGQDSIVGGLIGWAEKSPDDSTSTLISNSFASGAVTNHGDKAGGLIGYIDKGTVSNSVAIGDVSGYLNVGGLVGYSESTNIQMSSAQGHVSGSKYVGGLIGQFATNIPSTVAFSMASGLVEYLDSPAAVDFLISLDENQPGSIGGLIGFVNDSATLTNLSATGNVSIEATEGTVVSKIGGLIGANYSDVSQASASGDVTAPGGDSIGGLIGYEEYSLFHTSTSGTITGATQVGLLVGYCDAAYCINTSRFYGYSTATVDGTTDVWEGSGSQSSYNFDDSADGPTEPVAPPVLGVALLNYFDTPPDPLPWAQSVSVNGNQPHLRALLGTGFYLEPTPTPSTVTLAASAATSSSPTITFTITGNQNIDCTTLSATANEDFTFTNISAITAISQTSSTVCTITATSTAIANGVAVISTLRAADSFSITDTNGNAQTTLLNAPQSVTVTIVDSTPAPTESVTVDSTPAPTESVTTTSTVPANAAGAPSEKVIKALPRAKLTKFMITPGGRVTATQTGFVPGETVQLIVASTPRIIGTGVADQSGSVTVKGVIPKDLEVGEHNLALYSPANGFGFRQTFTVGPTTLPATGSTNPTRDMMIAMYLIALGAGLLLSRHRLNR